MIAGTGGLIALAVPAVSVAVVDLPLVDHKPLEEVLGGEVKEHIEARNEILVPHQVLGQPVAQHGGNGGEDAVVAKDFEHCCAHVGGGLEGKLTVEGEVPEDGQHQRDEVAGPIGPRGEFIEQRKGAHLDDACAGRKEHKLEHSEKFSVVFFCSHRKAYLCVFLHHKYNKRIEN